jgi:L-rhamnose isomerase / sugar isomerase
MGTTRSISLHVPWDDPADPEGLREYAAGQGIGFEAMNSNTFQDNPSTTNDGQVSYKFGSLANVDPDARIAERGRSTVATGLGHAGSERIVLRCDVM